MPSPSFLIVGSSSLFFTSGLAMSSCSSELKRFKINCTALDKIVEQYVRASNAMPHQCHCRSSWPPPSSSGIAGGWCYDDARAVNSLYADPKYPIGYDKDACSTNASRSVGCITTHVIASGGSDRHQETSCLVLSLRRSPSMRILLDLLYCCNEFLENLIWRLLEEQ